MARRAGQTALWVRVLLFGGIFGLSAGIAILAVLLKDGESIAFIGGMLIAGTLWFVAGKRGAWVLDGDNRLLGALLAGVITVAGGGSHTITAVVLSLRGELVEVSAVPLEEADEDGDRSYVLLPMDGGPTISGHLYTDRQFDDSRVATVLVDPAGFVRPEFPDGQDTVIWVLISLFGVGCLAATTIGAGFPITPRYSGVEGEDSEAGAAR